MSTPSPTSPPKRPRLSLQIRAIANGPTGRTSRSLAAAVDVKSPTSFNTLSNVYATAVDRSTPVQEKAPQTALNSRPSLRLQTQESFSTVPKERRTQTPYLGPYLDTPITAQPISPAVAKQVYFPSAMTATPPMSAQPLEQEGARVFTFENQGTPMPSSSRVPQSAAGNQPRRSKTLPNNNNLKLPYTHPRSLRSILRNSPLPPLSTKSPDSPRRQSLRLQEKAARRVAYNSPLTQTITTSKYTKSHVDLLAEDATPTTPSGASSDGEDLLDATMAYTGNETRDGGQTPGPFEEMRRRMAGLRASTPVTSSSTSSSPTSSGGIRKRGSKKKEKKRRWVWTIGQDGEDADELGSPVVGDPMDRSPEKKQAAVVSAVLPVTSSSVPVLAVPLPKGRTRTGTRMQAALKAAGALQAVSAPLPVQVQQQQQQVQETPVTAVLDTSASMSMDNIPRITTTPEPMTAIHEQQQQQHQQPQLVEPPTPSVESVASTCTTHSTQDSVFESSLSGAGDVEMSDANCDDHRQYTHTAAVPKLDTTYTIDALGVAMGISRGMDMDMDMDMDMSMNMDVDTATPTATVMVGIQ
ncbi:hypothetical protein V8F06_004091 [Rhypophila decipiens]